MSIRINWKTPTNPFDEILIYRTSAPFDYGSIPASPAVGGLTTEGTWLDTTAIQNTIYYYTIATRVGDEVILSPAQLAEDVPYNGPGPQTLLCGDMARGFFGLVNATELFTNAELIAALGGIFAINNVTQVWAKIASKGKVLFIAMHPVSLSVTWQSLYGYGLVYGMDNNGPANGNTLTPANQKKVVTKGEHDFMVRAMRANNTANYSGNFTNQQEGEWYPLLAAVFNLSPFAMSDAVVGSYFPGATHTLMAELVTPTTSPTGYVSGSFSNNTVTISSPYTWRPVLELIF